MEMHTNSSPSPSSGSLKEPVARRSFIPFHLAEPSLSLSLNRPDTYNVNAIRFHHDEQQRNILSNPILIPCQMQGDSFQDQGPCDRTLGSSVESCRMLEESSSAESCRIREDSIAGLFHPREPVVEYFRARESATKSFPTREPGAVHCEMRDESGVVSFWIRDSKVSAPESATESLPIREPGTTVQYGTRDESEPVSFRPIRDSTAGLESFHTSKSLGLLNAQNVSVPRFDLEQHPSTQQKGEEEYGCTTNESLLQTEKPVVNTPFRGTEHVNQSFLQGTDHLNPQLRNLKASFHSDRSGSEMHKQSIAISLHNHVAGCKSEKPCAPMYEPICVVDQTAHVGPGHDVLRHCDPCLPSYHGSYEQGQEPPPPPPLKNHCYDVEQGHAPSYDNCNEDILRKLDEYHKNGILFHKVVQKEPIYDQSQALVNACSIKMEGQNSRIHDFNEGDINTTGVIAMNVDISEHVKIKKNGDGDDLEVMSKHEDISNMNGENVFNEDISQEGDLEYSEEDSKPDVVLADSGRLDDVSHLGVGILSKTMDRDCMQICTDPEPQSPLHDRTSEQLDNAVHLQSFRTDDGNDVMNPQSGTNVDADDVMNRQSGTNDDVNDVHHQCGTNVINDLLHLQCSTNGDVNSVRNLRSGTNGDVMPLQNGTSNDVMPPQSGTSDDVMRPSDDVVRPQCDTSNDVMRPQSSTSDDVIRLGGGTSDDDMPRQRGKFDDDMPHQRGTSAHDMHLQSEKSDLVIRLQSATHVQVAPSEDVTPIQCALSEGVTPVQCAPSKDVTPIQCVSSEDVIPMFQGIPLDNITSIQAAPLDEVTSIQDSPSDDAVPSGSTLNNQGDHTHENILHTQNADSEKFEEGNMQVQNDDHGVTGFPLPRDRVALSHQCYPSPLVTHEAVVNNRELFMNSLGDFLAALGTRLTVPKLKGKELDLHELYRQVTSRGGLKQVIRLGLWKEISEELGIPRSLINASFILRKHYLCLLFHYEKVYFSQAQGKLSVELPVSLPGPSSVEPHEDSGSLYEPPPEIAASLRKRKKKLNPLHVFGADPAASIGAMATGVITGKLEEGYLITVVVGTEKLSGVLYHVPVEKKAQQYATIPSLRDGIGTEGDANGFEIQLYSKKRKEYVRKKDPNAPKRTRTGYNIFFKEQRARLKQLYPESKGHGKTVIEMWNKLPEKEKALYVARGNEEREKYLEEYRERMRLQSKTVENLPDNKAEASRDDEHVSYDASHDYHVSLEVEMNLHEPHRNTSERHAVYENCHGSERQPGVPIESKVSEGRLVCGQEAIFEAHEDETEYPRSEDDEEEIEMDEEEDAYDEEGEEETLYPGPPKQLVEACQGYDVRKAVFEQETFHTLGSNHDNILPTHSSFGHDQSLAYVPTMQPTPAEVSTEAALMQQAQIEPAYQENGSTNKLSYRLLLNDDNDMIATGDAMMLSEQRRDVHGYDFSHTCSSLGLSLPQEPEQASTHCQQEKISSDISMYSNLAPLHRNQALGIQTEYTYPMHMPMYGNMRLGIRPDFPQFAYATPSHPHFDNMYSASSRTNTTVQPLQHPHFSSNLDVHNIVGADHTFEYKAEDEGYNSIMLFNNSAMHK